VAVLLEVLEGEGNVQGGTDAILIEQDVPAHAAALAEAGVEKACGV
jgi:hypothetical protein